VRTIIILIASGLLIITAAITLKSCSNDGNIKVTTEKAERRTIIETVSANGKIQPEVEVKISPDVSGEIVELPIKEGDQVKKGDLLVKIRPDTYQSNLERMEASLNTSRANLSNTKARLAQVKAQFVNAENSYKRNKKLFDQGAISQADFDLATAAYEGATADVEGAQENVKASEFMVKSSEAALKEANDNLSKTTIYSPVNGTVSKLSVELGERVVGTSQMTGTELMRIANLNEMEVSVDVNENDIVRVSLNDTTLIEADAYLDRKFKGIVTEIANSANTLGMSSDQVTNFIVKVRILRESYQDLLNENTTLSPFRPGMSATVDIQTQTGTNLLSVPIQAVTTRMDSTIEQKTKKGKEKEEDEELVVKNILEDQKKKNKENVKPEECIFVYEDGVAKLIKVKTGIQDNNYIEIKQGIKDGQEIISGPYGAVSKLLKDDIEVKKVDKDELFTKSGKAK